MPQKTYSPAEQIGWKEGNCGILVPRKPHGDHHHQQAKQQHQPKPRAAQFKSQLPIQPLHKQHKKIWHRQQGKKPNELGSFVLVPVSVCDEISCTVVDGQEDSQEQEGHAIDRPIEIVLEVVAEVMVEFFQWIRVAGGTLARYTAC